jgi:hypothetical protein
MAIGPRGLRQAGARPAPGLWLFQRPQGRGLIEAGIEVLIEANCSIPAYSARARLFQTPPLRASCNLLICQAFNNRTKTGVVRLRQRKGPERDRKGYEMGFQADAHGSD